MIDALVVKGMPRANATVATVLATRTTGRTRPQLEDFVLTSYPGLEDKAITTAAVDQLIESGWLQVDPDESNPRCHAAPNIFSLMEACVGDPDLIRRVAMLRSAQSRQVDVIGPIYDDAVTLRFTRAISGARKMIRLPLLATPATFEYADKLQERARQGVQVRILLASPDVVASLRGESQRRRAEESVKGWTALTRAWPHTDVRVMHNEDEAVLAATSSFDDGKALLAVYDVRQQTSQQSTVLDVSQPGYVPNLVELYNRAFADAWRRARPVRGPARIAWWLERLTWQITLVISLLIAFTASNATVSSVAAGIAGTALLTLGVRFRSAAGRALGRLRSR